MKKLTLVILTILLAVFLKNVFADSDSTTQYPTKGYSNFLTNPDYKSYYQDIKRRICAKALNNYNSPQTGEVYVIFILFPNGKIKDVKIDNSKSMSNKKLNNIAIKSVKDASPFPPFPAALSYPELSFNVTLSFENENELKTQDGSPMVEPTEKQGVTQENKKQNQTSNEQTDNNTKVQEPTLSSEDILILTNKTKTNLKNNELMEIFNSPFHFISLQIDDSKFGRLCFLFGEGQISLEQKKRIFGDFVVDSNGKWQSKLVSINKINEDTLALEIDVVMRDDPIATPKPERRTLYFRYTNPGDVIFLVKLEALGTKQGDLAVNNEFSSGYAPEHALYSLYEGIMTFLGNGYYQFNGT